jgi:hypothetical protein
VRFKKKIWVLIAIKFPLSSAFTTFHMFWYFVFPFSLISIIFLVVFWGLNSGPHTCQAVFQEFLNFPFWLTEWSSVYSKVCYSVSMYLYTFCILSKVSFVVDFSFLPLLSEKIQNIISTFKDLSNLFCSPVYGLLWRKFHALVERM